MTTYKQIGKLMLSLLLVIGMIGTIFAVPTFAVTKPTLSAENKAVSAGEQFTVAISLENATSVYGGNFTLQYDSDLLTVDSYEFGTIVSGHTKNCNLDYQSAGNLIRATFSGASAVTASGTLITFTFTAKENVTGSAVLQFNAYKMYDENGVAITTTASSSAVTIVEAATAIPSYEMTDVIGFADSTVEVYVSIANNPGIISLRNSISYDTSALELVEVKDCELLAGYTTPSTTINSPYILRWADSLATQNNMENGRIAKLTFKIKEGTEVGIYNIGVNHVEARTTTGTKITFSPATATVTVIDYIVGDADGDREISDWDAIVLNRYLAGWDVEINLKAVDVDGDGEVSDWDAIVLERYLAGWDVELES